MGAEGQGCSDLRSRRCDRQCCRTRLCARGAKLFLTGRLRTPVDAVAKEIVSAGGSAEGVEVDALDEQAVDKHLQSVIDKAGCVDISFHAVGIPDTKILGVPLVELDAEQFSLPITNGKLLHTENHEQALPSPRFASIRGEI
jgi:NAD(P)-dependent dehydrogenase (short-subunit alcohol dehydrogenase family)